MTDLSKWHELVQLVKLRHTDTDGRPVDFGGKPVFSEYVLVPMSEYQLRNMAACITGARDSGDWHGELLTLAEYAALKAGWGKP